MELIDFKKTFKPLYSPKPGVPEIVCMPQLQFAMADGTGDPNTSQEFHDAIAALYSVAYGLKFSRKKQQVSPDFTMGPLEALWWTKTGKQFDTSRKGDWLWTLLLWMPNFITPQEFKSIVELTMSRKPNPALAKLRLDTLEEGMVVQIMHVGPYADEQPDIEKMFAFASEQGYQQCGKHHEIYLGDPRRADPQKLRTILRHPIKASTEANIAS